jgi:hypothetical protein
MAGQEVQPSPTPTLWGFDHTVSGSHVVAVANTPLGTFVHFLMYENVDNIIAALQAMKEKCAQARNGGGMVVPSQVMLGPDGQPIAVVPPSLETQAAAEPQDVTKGNLELIRESEGNVTQMPERPTPPPDDEDAGRRGD